MKIGEARSTYNAYCSQLTERYKELKEQAQKQQAAGNTEQAAATLTLSQDVLNKKKEIEQFARFDIPELIADMTNEALAPEQAKAAEKYAQDLMKIMEVARRIASGAKVPASDAKKLMDYDPDLYQTAVEAGAAMQTMKKNDKEYDSLWEDEEELEHTDMAELEEEILDSELNMKTPEIDTSLLENEMGSEELI